MKTIYIDCGMGAAGDMLTAALLDTLSEKGRQDFVNKINGLKIPGLSFSCQPSVKCGITGSHVTVMINGEEELSHDYDDHQHDHDHNHDHDHDHNHDHDHDHGHEHNHDDHCHSHSDLKTVSEIVDSLKVSDKVKTDVKNIYHIIAEAEGHVHGKPVDQIHFHEVGNMDAIVDVTAVCLLMEMIGADRIMASPVHVGSGKVKCAHGILPIPAPATAHILMGVPIYSGEIQGELCTPTGAALLKYFVKDFVPMPIMKTTAIGYGMGNKDFKVANSVRVLVGETEDERDTILNLSCNVDDMTPEALGFAMEQIFEAGAADVFIMPVTMKKCRPGHVINVIARPELKAKIIEAIMKHTSTIGIRETVCKRNILKREFEEIKTPLGTVKKKISTGYGVTREKYEYEDIAKIAKENGMSISEVEKIVSSCE